MHTNHNVYRHLSLCVYFITNTVPPPHYRQDYEDDGSAVRAYCTTGGIVLTCDARFIDWFGKTINDCVGRSFGSLTMDAGAVEQ